MIERLLRRVGYVPYEPPLEKPVTFRTITVCFSARTLDVDGRRISADPDFDCISLPILSGDAVFAPTRAWERIA